MQVAKRAWVFHYSDCGACWCSLVVFADVCHYTDFVTLASTLFDTASFAVGMTLQGLMRAGTAARTPLVTASVAPKVRRYETVVCARMAVLSLVHIAQRLGVTW